MQPLTPRVAVEGVAPTSTATETPASQGPASGDVRAVKDGARNAKADKIVPYRARFGRSRPVVAMIAANSGTELTDFFIPFGLLSQSKAAEVVMVSPLPGAIKMFPSLQIAAQITLEQFDDRYAHGADYVVVPALANDRDPIVLAWISAQAAKGGTIVSICNGSIVVANTGLLNGHRATGHWGSERFRAANYHEVLWEKNIRYISDGKTVSSSGISASIPISIALVEAIAGHDRAAETAKDVGVSEWGSRHDSDAFQHEPEEEAKYPGSKRAPRESVGVPVAYGVDEVAVALTAEAYSHSGRALAFALATKPDSIRTRRGLVLIPDRVVGRPPGLDRVLPEIEPEPSTQALDRALSAVEAIYGHAAAYASARIMEYPGIQERSASAPESPPGPGADAVK